MIRNAFTASCLLLLFSCSRNAENANGEQLAREFCDCRSKVPLDEKGVPADMSRMVECSAIKVRAMKKLEKNKVEMEKFEKAIGSCGDWQFKNK